MLLYSLQLTGNILKKFSVMDNSFTTSRTSGKQNKNNKKQPPTPLKQSFAVRQEKNSFRAQKCLIFYSNNETAIGWLL